MSEAYLNEMREYRKSLNAMAMIRCRRSHLQKASPSSNDVNSALTRDQADLEISQLRSQYAWNDNLSDQELAARLKPLTACRYFTIAQKAQRLELLIKLRNKLLTLRQSGQMQEALWELLCFSLLDGRAYILNGSFLSEVSGHDVHLWKKELQELRSTDEKFARACGPMLVVIEDHVAELSRIAGSPTAATSSAPVTHRLIEQENRRIRQNTAKNVRHTETASISGWHWGVICFGAIMIMFRGCHALDMQQTRDVEAFRILSNSHRVTTSPVPGSSNFGVSTQQRENPGFPSSQPPGLPALDPEGNKRLTEMQQQLRQKLDQIRDRDRKFYQPPTSIPSTPIPSPPGIGLYRYRVETSARPTQRGLHDRSPASR